MHFKSSNVFGQKYPNIQWLKDIYKTFKQMIVYLLKLIKIYKRKTLSLQWISVDFSHVLMKDQTFV